MLEEAYSCGVSRVVIALGYTDLRLGIDGLARIVKRQFDLNPFEPGVLFLFCGRRADRIKGLLWEGTGFLLLYKRLEDGAFNWPRTEKEARELSQDEFRLLMQGDYPLRPLIHKVYPQDVS